MGTRLSQLPRGSFDDSKRIEGTSARVELRPGQWLTEQMVAAQELVKRNEAVTMRLVRGPIEITTPGLTHQGGARGEVIRVENIQSKREVYARVISKDEVQVIF
jgi:flagella basal body P-ring formation protein FlgA